MKNKSNKKIVSLITAFVLSISLNANADEKLDGQWEGNLEVLGSKLDISVNIDSKDENNIKATIDIPQQGAKGLVLKNVIYKKPKIYMNLAEANNASFEGQITEDDKISGIFKQSGFEGTFNLTKKDIKQAKVSSQVSYREEEVNLKNGDVNLAGTLSFPDKKGTFPAVVLITGSGPQNRDEEIMGFKLFKVIADHLNKNGIAVLRLDDRGVGMSKGGNIEGATSLDYASDIEKGVEFLSNHKEINPDKIGLLGHSEGGLIAPYLANKNNKVSFMVLVAGPAQVGEQLLVEQNKSILNVSNLSQEKINDALEQQREVLEAVKTNKGWDKIKAKIKSQVIEDVNKLPNEAKKQIKDLNLYAEDYANNTIKTLNNNWIRFFISHDPLPILEKTKIPVLAIFGEKDLQVPSKINSQLMERAFIKAGNKNYKVITIPKANHLFQSANTGSPDEYSKLEKNFVPEFLDLVSDWVVNTTK